MTDDVELLNRLSTTLTRELREYYFNSVSSRQDPYTQPPDIVYDEPLGPWPEIILHSISCVRSSAGRCTPCFYSRVQPVNLPFERIYESVIDQITFVLDNFDDLVISRQTRTNGFPGFAHNQNNKPALLALGMTGSIFSDKEVPSRYRHEILRRVVDYSLTHKINLQLLIASHARDVILQDRAEELLNISEILRPISVVNLMGFESYEALSRNGLYAKGLQLHEFEDALEINQKYGFTSGAYVFTGLHSMTQNEIILDVNKSLHYLYTQGVVPVLMWPHLQPYTINHLLYVYGKYQIIEPRTLMAITKDLLTIYDKPNQAVTDPWFIAMEGGPPEPVGGVFQNPSRITCDSCSNVFKAALRALRRNYNPNEYFEKVNSLESCECREKYERYLLIQESLSSRTLFERAIENLEFAAKMKEEYLKGLQP